MALKAEYRREIIPSIDFFEAFSKDFGGGKIQPIYLVLTTELTSLLIINNIRYTL